MTTSKTYLNVPYAEKDAAKTLGAKWDPAKKKWYAPTGKAISDFSKWYTKSNSETSNVKNGNSEGVTTYPKDKNFVAYNGELPPWD